jgi:hypothetical protein
VGRAPVTYSTVKSYKYISNSSSSSTSRQAATIQVLAVLYVVGQYKQSKSTVLFCSVLDSEVMMMMMIPQQVLLNLYPYCTAMDDDDPFISSCDTKTDACMDACMFRSLMDSILLFPSFLPFCPFRDVMFVPKDPSLVQYSTVQ